jgi:CBS domain containing-hemolysin-like protein
LERLLEMFISSEYSRILVYRETIDNIVGFVHSFDMFRSPDSITKVMKPIFYVPESMMASYALNMFIQNHRSLAVVVDEFGGTSGIVTIEDVMEEIFGEIEDEFDSGDLVEQKISDKEYLFSARLEIDYLNEKYNLHLPESEEYKTLAGLIIHYYESIPDLNEKIIIEHFQFDIVEVAENRIEMARLVIAEEREESTKVR